MTSNAHGVTPSYGLLRAAEAVTNWRALAATALAGLAILLSVFLTVVLAKGGFVLGAVGVVLTLVVALTGYSAVGILLMRQAQQQPIGIIDAFTQAIFTVHRLLGVALMMLLIVIVVSIGATLILLLCKIPALGSLLYAVALPVLTVVIGAIIAGMLYVALPLAAPAVWEGNTVWQTTARLLVIMRQRLAPVIINLVILSLLVFVLAGVVSLVLYSGYLTTAGLSAAVGINPFGGVLQVLQNSMMGGGISGVGGMGAYGGYGGGYEGQSYTGAMAFATGLLLMVGGIIPGLTYINGSCLVYLQSIDGLHFGQAEEEIRSRMDEAKRVAKEAKDRANAQMQAAKASAQRPATETAVPAAAVAPAAPAAAAVAPAAAAPVAPVAQRACVACHAPLAQDDVFCGECGKKND